MAISVAHMDFLLIVLFIAVAGAFYALGRYQGFRSGFAAGKEVKSRGGK